MLILSFPIPYNGENAILNTVLGTDYSALNSFVLLLPINVEPDGFYPPEGSVFNSDSSVVTLPEASTESDYNESISFYATEEISIPDVGSFGFVSANITSVSTPAGMSYVVILRDVTLDQMHGDMLLLVVLLQDHRIRFIGYG